MTQPYRGRQAVFLVTAPPDFVPQRPWDVPPRFLSGDLYAKNLTMTGAQEFARTYNKRAVQDRERGEWNGKWAIVAKHLKARRHGKHPLAERGGAVQ